MVQGSEEKKKIEMGKRDERMAGKTNGGKGEKVGAGGISLDQPPAFFKSLISNSVRRQISCLCVGGRLQSVGRVLPT